jgi:hypothetical protein
LAWESGRDEIHFAAKSSALEGSQVRPDRRGSQGTLFHLFDQVGSGEGFPLHESHVSEVREDSFNSEFKSSNPGT